MCLNFSGSNVYEYKIACFNLCSGYICCSLLVLIAGLGSPQRTGHYVSKTFLVSSLCIVFSCFLSLTIIILRGYHLEQGFLTFS